MKEASKSRFSRLLLETSCLTKELENLEVVAEYELSPSTLLVADIIYGEVPCSLVLDETSAPRIVQRSVSTLFAITAAHSIFSDPLFVKECCKLVKASACKLPFCSPVGVFIPFAGSDQTCWINSLAICDIRSETDPLSGQKNSVLSCVGKLELVIPCEKRTIRNRLANVYLLASVYADICRHFIGEKITNNEVFSLLLERFKQKLYHFSKNKCQLLVALDYKQIWEDLQDALMAERLLVKKVVKTRQEAEEHVKDLLAM